MGVFIRSAKILLNSTATTRITQLQIKYFLVNKQVVKAKIYTKNVLF